MANLSATERGGATLMTRILSFLGRLFVALVIPAVAFLVIYGGFIFLRDSDAPKWIVAVVAIVWGVGGVALLYTVFNGLVERMPAKWTALLQPFVFVGPGMVILIWYLALPAVRTGWLSLFDRTGTNFVGLSNYVSLFSQRLLTEAIRNNVLWIVFGSTFTVAFGLLVAVLADRSRFERFAKTLIFLPMAISFVGAGVIWNFMYSIRPGDSVQIGLLNAIITSLGGTAKAWTAWTAIAPWNNLFLIVIVIWLQAGFAMVLFSAALKGIPDELLEAGRVDGATEIQIFFRIMIPYIMGTIITVWTTIVIFTLKIFDVVWVMTGGQFGTEVIATQFIRQSFVANNTGIGSAIAIILLIAVIPVMIYNLRQFREQEAF
ncbi:MAG: sugar ABC transporter permease [Anaerolineales bacterium]|nr:sugar ABC transporter permease [Anaerolineales bacterium]